MTNNLQQYLQKNVQNYCNENDKVSICKFSKCSICSKKFGLKFWAHILIQRYENISW